MRRTVLMRSLVVAMVSILYMQPTLIYGAETRKSYASDTLSSRTVRFVFADNNKLISYAYGLFNYNPRLDDVQKKEEIIDFACDAIEAYAIKYNVAVIAGADPYTIIKSPTALILTSTLENITDKLCNYLRLKKEEDERRAMERRQEMEKKAQKESTHKSGNK